MIKQEINKTDSELNKIKKCRNDINHILNGFDINVNNLNEVPNKLQVGMSSVIKYAETEAWGSIQKGKACTLTFTNPLDFTPKRLIILYKVTFSGASDNGPHFYGVDSLNQNGAKGADNRHIYVIIQNFTKQDVTCYISTNPYGNSYIEIYKVIALG